MHKKVWASNPTPRIYKCSAGIPPMEFRVFSRLRGRRSWTEGLQRFASPPPRLSFSTCTRCPGLRSSSYGHGSSCTGAASSFRPRTSPGRHDAAWYDPRRLPEWAVLFPCSGRTRDDVSGRTSWLSAILSRSHAAPHSSVRPGTAVHVRHNIFSHTAPALGIPDICTVSAVFLAFVSSPASKKDRWRSNLGPSSLSCWL